jgi:galactokinase
MPPRNRVVAFAPGRVNLIGEHTDYNQGLALPFAISQGVTVTATALDGRRLEVYARNLRQSDSFDIDRPKRISGWRAFVHGAAAELAAAGFELRGARVEISGNIPRGAGLSSSAALEVALTIAILTLSDAPEIDLLKLAKICSKVENEWVGARTGLLDQLASLFGERGRALRIDFRSLSRASVPLKLDNVRLITVPSGERHANRSSGYNQRRDECAHACKLLGVSSLREIDAAAAQKLPSPLRERALHVVTENGRVEAAVGALERGDSLELGALLDRSHASLRDCYEVSTPALEATVERCRLAGALGARLVGGGFGGSVLALMPVEAAMPSEAVEVTPSAGARVLSS